MTNEEIERLEKETTRQIGIKKSEFITIGTPDVVIDGNAILSLIERVKAADKMAALIEHALELGHLGEGSTKGWAEDVLAEYRKASEGKCPPHSWDRSGERCTKCGDKDWMS